MLMKLLVGGIVRHGILPCPYGIGFKQAFDRGVWHFRASLQEREGHYRTIDWNLLLFISGILVSSEP